MFTEFLPVDFVLNVVDPLVELGDVHLSVLVSEHRRDTDVIQTEQMNHDGREQISTWLECQLL